MIQLEASKSRIKDLFNDLLNETKGFKYQITLKVMLQKYEPSGEIEFAPVCSNSITKTVINHNYIGLLTRLMKDLAGLLN